MAGASSFTAIDLGSFESDGARLAAIGIVALALIVIGCAKPISESFVKDRENRRKHEREKSRLERKIGRRITGKKESKS